MKKISHYFEDEIFAKIVEKNVYQHHLRLINKKKNTLLLY